MEDYSRPVLPGTAPTDYERYLRTDELLSLQKRPEERAHRDELLFQVVHQSAELWLKFASSEVAEATRLLVAGNVVETARLLGRAARSMTVVAQQTMMLELLPPWDYHAFRGSLGHGSGFDSPGFRQLQQQAAQLGEAFDSLLANRHVSLVDVYEHREENQAMYQLAEQLIELDERVGLWRTSHLKLVERLIGGHAIGTQGQPVEVLSKRLTMRLFPQLWDLRDELTRRANTKS